MTLAALTSAAIVRADDAEELVSALGVQRLLLDAADTGGAISAHTILLRNGAEGANPHRHLCSTEVFFVLAGSVDLLTGDRVVRAGERDLVVVPPGVDHAFAAAPGADGELLVMITPGVDRFDLFRELHRLVTGVVDPGVLRAQDPERFDNHPALGDAWSTRADVCEIAENVPGLRLDRRMQL